MAVANPTYLPVAARSRGLAAARAKHLVRGVATTVLRSVAVFIPVFFVATFATFALRSLSGLNPARVQLGQDATPAEIHRIEASFGLNRPFLVQYWNWLSGLLHGNLGISWSNHYPVSTLLKDSLTVTLTVAGFALVLGVVFGFLFGSLGALRHGTWIDRVLTGGLTVLSVVPAFVVGIVLIEVVAVELKLLPSAGFLSFSHGFWPWLSHIILPSLALSLAPAAHIARQLRGGLVGAYRENYVIGATVRGLNPRRIFFRHVLRNGMSPALAVLGLEFPAVIGNSVVTETIFALSGFGQFARSSAQAGDVPSVQGVLVVSILLVVTFNLIVNIVLGRVTPAAQRGV
jgi:peptide/nickel transport system permease protein